MLLKLLRYAGVLLGAILAVNVQAGIVLNTTRVIYAAADKEVSFGVHNGGSGEILLQSWLESEAGEREESNLPFIITPALAHMRGDSRQLLRIIYAGTGMATDRESVFWLNVQEIPQAAPENSLQIAIRQWIKVFFRPDGLKGEPLQAPESLQWRVLNHDVLQVDNPGPYHVSMVRIEAHQGSVPVMSHDRQMLAPQQSLRMPLNHRVGDAPLSLSFISVNDFGGQVPYSATLPHGSVTQASKVDPS